MPSGASSSGWVRWSTNTRLFDDKPPHCDTSFNCPASLFAPPSDGRRYVSYGKVIVPGSDRGKAEPSRPSHVKFNRSKRQALQMDFNPVNGDDA